MTLSANENRRLDFMARSIIRRNAYSHSRRLYRAANGDVISEPMRAARFEQKWLRFTQDLHHFPLEMFAGVGVRRVL